MFLQALLVLVVMGALTWLAMRAPFIDERFKPIIFWVAITCAVVFLLKIFGIWGALGNV